MAGSFRVGLRGRRCTHVLFGLRARRNCTEDVETILVTRACFVLDGHGWAGGGLNVTCLSYAGQIHFGLTIEPSLVPDPWRLIDGLHEALATYSALAGKPSRRGKRTAGKTAAAPRKKPTTGRKKPATRRKKPAPGRPSTRKT